MDLIDATLLGLVEGLTEFVPVSSTGHLILAGAWLGLDHTEAQKHAVDAFDIVIQAGAWLACVWYYWPLLMERYGDLRAQTPERVRQGRNLLQGLAIAFVPVMVVGLLARKQIKALFFGPTTVAAALAVGGVVMIAADLWLRAKEKAQAGQPLEALTRRQSVLVGAFQCLALIPGTSRSMATMLGGLFAGMNRKAAADFSFLLAIPVLGAATAYELLKEWQLLLNEIGVVAIVIGLIAAFLSGLASISVFLKIIGKFGLVPFGIYRIVLAAVVWKSLL
jgi:undecaprenyl-diphosphatase